MNITKYNKYKAKYLKLKHHMQIDYGINGGINVSSINSINSMNTNNLIKKQIIAIGGGKITNANVSTEIRQYLYNMVINKDRKPIITLIPQARLGAIDFEPFINDFKKVFEQTGFHVNIIRMHGRVDMENISKTLLSSDIVYVSGGNTFNLITLWKGWCIDTILREAYNKGVIMAGTSAGMNCWYEQCITDSRKDISIMDCVGFIAGTASPHFDSEIDRKPYFLESIKNNSVKPPYIAINDYTAAYYIDGKLVNGLVWKNHLGKIPDVDNSLFEIDTNGLFHSIKCVKI